MGQHPLATRKDAVDLVVTNALILDYTGIYKADIGIKKESLLVLEKRVIL